VKKCIVCGNIIPERRSVRNTTCGNFRCVRANRATAKYRKSAGLLPRKREDYTLHRHTPDTAGRAQIHSAWKESQALDMSWQDRLIFICRAANVTPATAISTLKSLGVE
jgi:hypothetical protein